MDEKELEELELWLSNTTIPDAPPQKRTLLDIMGIRTLENPWSNIYAFFLNENEEHGFGDLFIRTLEKLMELEKDRITPTEIKVEQPTYKKSDGNNEKEKRIDILIKDDTHKRAIIIENKVFHRPVNPFSEYIEYVKRIGYEDIRVVILSLNKISKKDEDIYPELKKIKELTSMEYVSLTHKEFMDEIKRDLPKYSNVNPFYQTILEHFMQNIENITNMVTDEEIEFFYSHFEKIHKINYLLSRLEDGYKNVLKTMDFGKDSKVEISDKNFHTNENDSWIYIRYKENQSVLLTIFFLNNQLRVILELKRDAFIKIKETALTALTGKNIQHKENTYWHIDEEYIELETNDLNPLNLRNTLQKIIDSYIYNLGLKVVELLKKPSDKN
ncbi:MAG: PD-(D/E)XK nuclease family protein [Bacteroidales bacterium]|nr:PD-(D/E)XK nuclease family protein [Bacteroidales bacterium]